LTLQQWWAASRQVEVIPYSEFEQLLKKKDIVKVFVRDQYLEGQLKKPLADGRKQFFTTRVEPGLATHLDQFDVGTGAQ